jgi:hypothetical protein
MAHVSNLTPGSECNPSVRVLPDQRLVERLCNTKPDESPVKYVKAMGAVLGMAGRLVESRGHIVKVKFTAAGGGGGGAWGAGGGKSKRGFTETTLWLPKEAVVVVSPWVSST